jgi:AcrR family transcriptional regulator
MSGNVAKVKTNLVKSKTKTAAKPGAKTDRRVLRTRDALGDALIELMRTKPFDDITVQEVLDRAGVGRSTFYAHYSDKEDLFLSDVEDFFQLCSTMLTRNHASPGRLAPVAELFAHVSEVRVFYGALVASGKADDVKALGRGFFARSIEERLRMRGVEEDQVQLAAQAYALSGSMFALLDWWIDHGMKADPKQMDALFHRMAWNGIQRSPVPK